MTGISLKEAMKCFALGAIGLLALALVLVVLRFSWDYHSTTVQANLTLSRISGVADKLGAAADSFKQTSDATTAAINEQKKVLHQQARALAITTSATADFVMHTDHSINGCNNCPPGLIPTATAQLKSTQPGIDNFNRSMATLADTLDAATPPIKDAAMSVKTSGENIEGITADWKQISDETNAFLHAQYNPTKPTLAHRILMIILNSVFNGAASGAVRR